jgi:hypothetical protein
MQNERPNKSLEKDRHGLCPGDLSAQPCGIALKSTALARLQREQVIRPDNPDSVGAVSLAIAIGKTPTVFPQRRLRLQLNSAFA